MNRERVNAEVEQATDCNAHSDDDGNELKMAEEEAEKVNEMLDDAARSAVNRLDLRSGFYTDPSAAGSWHHMSDADINEHHRSGIYRHSRHPLSSVEPPGERHRKSSRQALVPPAPASTASVTFFTPSLTSVTEADNAVVTAEATAIPVVSESSPLLSGNVAEAGIGTKDVVVGFASGDSGSITEPSDKESASKIFLSPTEEPPIPSTHRLYTRQESTPKVSFILGADPDDVDANEPASAPSKQIPSKTSTSAKTRRSSTATSLQQDPLHRRRPGSEMSPMYSAYTTACND